MAAACLAVILLGAIPASLAIFIGGEQDVGSPLRVAQCRATCLEKMWTEYGGSCSGVARRKNSSTTAPPARRDLCFHIKAKPNTIQSQSSSGNISRLVHPLTIGRELVMHTTIQFSNDGPNGESMCLQGPDCFMCWENCELLQSNFQVWGAMCEEREICFPGCQEACRFHAEASTRAQQSQPVIHTKGEGVIRVIGPLAKWPRPSSVSLKTPLVYVVMRKSLTGPWRQIIQTLDLTTRVPLNSDQGGAMLRVLVVDPQGLVTIYSPDESSVLENKKKKKTINTEIKATTSKSVLNDDEPWTLREVSLIHQKVLVIGEIAWEPKAIRGVYLVTWEVDGGGLKGNLFTDSTCVTLSLWPDTIYHIQVELVSKMPGVDNLKSEMMNLDTGRAQKVSTESQEDLNIIQNDSEEEVDFESPLLSVLVSAVRGKNTTQKWRNYELILGSCAAIMLFSIILAIAFWKCRRRSGMAFDNMITGSTSIRGHKLVEDLSGYTGFQPIMTLVSSVNEKTTMSDSRGGVHPTPDVAFSGVSSDPQSGHTNEFETSRTEVQV